MGCNLHSIKCFYMHVFTVYNFSSTKQKKTEKKRERTQRVSWCRLFLVFLFWYRAVCSAPFRCILLAHYTYSTTFTIVIPTRRATQKRATQPKSARERERKCENEKWHAHICIQSQINCTSEFNLCTIQSLFLSLCCSVSIFPSLPSSPTPVSFQRSSSLCFTRCICKVLMLVDFLHLDYFAERKLRIVWSLRFKSSAAPNAYN